MIRNALLAAGTALFALLAGGPAHAGSASLTYQNVVVSWSGFSIFDGQVSDGLAHKMTFPTTTFPGGHGGFSLTGVAGANPSLAISGEVVVDITLKGPPADDPGGIGDFATLFMGSFAGPNVEEFVPPFLMLSGPPGGVLTYHHVFGFDTSWSDPEAGGQNFNVGVSDDNAYAFIDPPVPEPATWALMLAGLGASMAGATRARRRRV